MNYRPEELAARLKAEGDAVVQFFQNLTPDQWEVEVYLENGGWRVRDLLAHFIATEQGFQQLVQNVSTGGSGSGVDFDIEEYNARTVKELRAGDQEVLLAQFAMNRERTVALVRGLRMDQLTQTGRHPALGVAPLGDMIRLMYHHNQLHLRDARRALRSPGTGRQMQTGVVG